MISGLLAVATFGSVAALVGALQGPQAKHRRRLRQRMQNIGDRAAKIGAATPAMSLRRQEGEGSGIEKIAKMLLPRPKLLKQRLARTGRRITLGRYAIVRSEENTSELQSLMRISYAVLCLKQKTTKK